MKANDLGATQLVDDVDDDDEFFLVRVTNGVVRDARIKFAVAVNKRFREAFAPSGDPTIDTPLLQLCIDSGGFWQLQDGTYVHSGLTMRSGAHLVGQGRSRTVLKLAAGSNVDSIIGENFVGLTNTGSTGGVYDWGLEHLTIDGNKSQQSGTSNGVRVYGYDFVIDHAIVVDALSNGWHLEWKGGGGSPAAPHYNMEANLRSAQAHTCGGHGFYILGPHDSILDTCLAIKNAGAGFWALNSGSSGAGGVIFKSCHAWGNEQTYGFRLGCSAYLTANCYAEGASIAQVFVESGIGSIDAYVLGAGASVPVGIVMGGASTVSGWTVSANIRDCTSGAISFANETENEYDLYVYQTSGTVMVGSANANSRTHLHTAGLGATTSTQQSRNYMRGATTVRASSGNGFLVTSPAGIDHLNVNISNTRIEIPRAVDVQMYSDSYTTETIKLAGATGQIVFGDNAAGPSISAGAGSPEGVLTAPVGSMYLRNDGTTSVLYTKMTGSGNTGWVAPTSPMAVPFNASTSGSHTITTMPLAATLMGSGRATTQLDLSRFSRVRLACRVNVASASASNPRIRLRYYTTFSNTTSDFLEIGASEVSCSLAAVTVSTSGWINLVAGAKADVVVSVDTIGGDGAISPIIGSLIAVFE